MRRVVAMMAVSALVLAVSAREWFDGGIDRYWPDFASGGAWTIGGSGYFRSDALRIDAEPEAPVFFTARTGQTMPDTARLAGFTTEMVFGSRDTLPDPADLGTVAITVLRTGVDSFSYYVLEKDGATNRWTAVAGEPDVEKRCTVAFEMVESNGGPRVTYTVDGAVLAVKDVVGDASVKEVGYVGGGEVTSLVGTFETDKVRFDLLTPPDVLVGSVYVGGTRLAYPYETVSGSVVRVEYHAIGDRCFASGETTALKEFEIDADRQVVAVPPEAVPVTAVARVKDTRYASLEDACASARDGDAITILADVDGVQTMGLVGKGAITLDLNGHVVEGAGTGPLIRVGAGTSLTIRDGDATVDDRLRQIADATLVSVEGGSVVLEGRAGKTFAGEDGGVAFAVAEGAAVTVNGGVVAGTLTGADVTVNVYTNGDRLASAAFSQDETARLPAAVKAAKRGMRRHADGFWSVDTLIRKLGTLWLVR